MTHQLDYVLYKSLIIYVCIITFLIIMYPQIFSYTEGYGIPNIFLCIGVYFFVIFDAIFVRVMNS